MATTHSSAHTPRPAFRGIVAVAALLVAGAALAFPTQIPVRTDAGGTAAGQTWPLGFGVPLQQGQVTNLASLGLATSSGALVPATFEARKKWPDGSVQWLWVDAVGPVAPAYNLTFTGQKAALPSPGVTVSNSSSALVVDAGALRVTWSKTWGAPTQVALDNAAGSPVVVGTADGRGVYMIDQNGAPAALGGGNGALNWRVETANPLRAVVRVEGYYTTAAGAQLARAIVRYHFAYNQPFVRIEHTFVVTRDNESTRYREIGVRMPLSIAASSTASFGRAGTTPYSTTVTNSGDQAWVFQSSVPHYHNTTSRYAIGRGASTLTSGARADGWAELVNGSKGAVMQVRDFAEQFPIEINATWQGLTAKLWSGRDGRVLDFRPATMVKDFWGADWAQKVSTSPSAPWTYSQLLAYNPSAVGVARTHELTVGYYHGAANATRTSAWTRAFQNGPVLLPDPRWTMHVDARLIPPMAARGEVPASYAAIDRLTNIFFDEHMVAERAWPNTGFYDWGKMPDLRNEKDAQGVWLQFTRLNYTNQYYVVADFMLSWLRTGDRRFLDTASRYNRMVADYQIVHSGGGKDKKLLGRFTFNGAQHHPVYWGGQGIFYGHSSREHVYGWMLEYFFRDARWLKDNVDLVTSQIAPYLRAQMTAAGGTRAGQQKAVYNAFRCEPFPGLAVLESLWAVNGNPDVLAFARMLYTVTTDRADPGGIDKEFFATYRCTGGALYKPDRTAQSLVRYFDMTQDAGAKTIVNLIARYAMTQDKLQPFGYQNLSGAYVGRLYQWSRAADLQTFIKGQLDRANALVAAYERSAQKSMSHWMYYLGPIGHQGLNHWRYAFKSVPGFGSTTAILDVSAPSNGAALYGLPAAAWALSGFPSGLATTTRAASTFGATAAGVDDPTQIDPMTDATQTSPTQSDEAFDIDGALARSTDEETMQRD